MKNSNDTIGNGAVPQPSVPPHATIIIA